MTSYVYVVHLLKNICIFVQACPKLISPASRQRCSKQSATEESSHIGCGFALTQFNNKVLPQS